MPSVYVQNVKFGVDLDTAFMNSFSTGGYTIVSFIVIYLIDTCICVIESYLAVHTPGRRGYPLDDYRKLPRR